MERIFKEMNKKVVSMRLDTFPAEALTRTEPPRSPWIPYDEEIADRINEYPAQEQQIYRKAVNEVLRGIKLNNKIQNMIPRWKETTPLEILRQLDIDQVIALPRVSKKAAERTLVLVQ